MTTSANNLIEPLEDRRMFSVSIDPVGRFLRIQGTESANRITVRESNVNILGSQQRMLLVTEGSGPNARTTPVRASDVRYILVNSLGGDDVITLNTSMRTKVFAGNGNDRVSGGSGADEIHGDMSYLQVIGRFDIPPTGNDVIFGNRGRDRIFGDNGDDVLRGGLHDDVIDGGAGIDQMFGDENNDTLLAKDRAGGEIVDGGDGADTAQTDQFFGEVEVSPGLELTVLIHDEVSNVETVTH